MRIFHSYLLILFLFVTSCSKQDETERPVNPYRAEYNHILAESLHFGAASNYSWFLHAEPSTDGESFYVSGELDAAQATTSGSIGGNNSVLDYYESVLLKFDKNGNKLWETRPGFEFRTILVVAPGVLTEKENIVLIGADGNDQDLGRTRVMVFDDEGTFLFSHEEDNLYYHFGSIVDGIYGDAVRFLSVGHEYLLDGSVNPTIFDFQLTRNDISWKGKEIWTIDREGSTFTDIKKKGTNYFISSIDLDYNPETPAQRIYISSYSPDFTSNWGYSIYRNGKELEYAEIALSEDAVFLMAPTEDGDKEINSINQHWFSTVIYAFELNGNERWASKYYYTDYHDKGQKLLYHNNNLYLSGIVAGHQMNNGILGNAFISKIRPSNGDLIGNVKDFGDSTLLQSYYGMVFIGNNCWAVGETRNIQESAQAWMSKIPANKL
ncbi:MAG: hypothetical protein R2792_05850 [Saprospiraceae bacterium]